MMNMIQWPFASAVNANMKNTISQMMNSAPPNPTTYLLLYCGDAAGRDRQRPFACPLVLS